MEKYIYSDGKQAEYISSRNNERVLSASKLKDRKYREAEGVFLCEGVKLTEEALTYGEATDIFVREDAFGVFAEKLGSSVADGTRVSVLSSPAFEKITTEKSPQGVISVVKYPKNYSLWRGDAPEGMILMLESVMDPGNVGTILRSACAFGCSAVVLSGCADVFGTKTVRGAMGALFKQRIIRADDGAEFIRAVNREGRRTLAATLGDRAVSLGGYDIGHDDCVIIGNEGHGIKRDIIEECSDRVFIPMNENTESLNAAMAATVILWEYYRDVGR